MKKQMITWSKDLDKIGTITSFICAIHCFILPFLIVVLPIFSLSLLVTETFEWLFLIATFLLGMTSLCLGYKKHKSYKAIVPLMIGLTLILVIRLFGNHHSHFEFNIYNFLLLFGGLLISISHQINKYLCNSCKKCSLDHEKN